MNTIVAKSIALFLLSVSGATGAIPVTGTFTYTQDFDTLPTAAGTIWTDNSTIPGWWLHRSGSSPPNSVTIVISDGTGSSINGGLYSLGAPGSAERALGAVPRTELGDYSSFAIFANLATIPLRVTNVKYDVEVWRTNTQQNTSESIQFSSRITDAEDLITSNPGSEWIGDAALDFVHPGDAANNVPRPPDVGTTDRSPDKPIIVFPGQFLAVRWTNQNSAGFDAFMGIDNVIVEFTPHPGALSVSVSEVTTHANGTPSEPHDDTFSFDILVTRFDNGGSGWISSVGPEASGAYGSIVTVTGVPVSQSPLSFTLNDRENPGFPISVMVAAPILEAELDATITFTEPAEGAQNYTRTLTSRDLGWSGGSMMAAVRLQPSPNSTSKYLDISNARPTLITEAVNVSMVDEFEVAVDLAAYTTFPTTFETNDTVGIQVETAQSGSGPWTIVAHIVDASQTDGFELFDEIKVSDPGTGYVAADFPVADFPFVTKHSGVIPRGTASYARLVVSGGNDSATEHLLIDNIIFRRPPDISVEQRAATALTDGTAVVNFGTVAAGSSASLSFTVRNGGVGTLRGLSLLLNGTHAEEFAITSAPAVSLQPGAFTTFTIRFAPAGSGLRNAALQIASNDGDENPFDIILTGRTYTSLEGWRLLYFGSENNAGPAADRSDPDGDGIANLLEFGFAMNPVTADASSMPQWQWNGNNFNLEFTSPPGTDALIYRAEWSTRLTAGTWTGIPNLATPPQYRFVSPNGTAGRAFLRMRIVAP